ncbi:MAG: hypothetical protein ACRDRL_13765 [Sciscionella sp.]
MTPVLVNKAHRIYDSWSFTMAEIAASYSVTPTAVYRHIRVDPGLRPAGEDEPMLEPDPPEARAVYRLHAAVHGVSP